MKYIYGMCMVIGFLVLLGSAGASDCGTLEFEETLFRVIGGLLVGAIGVVGFKGLEERETETQETDF